jgi:tRNA(Ile)-lysidine synthetase-like protein
METLNEIYTLWFENPTWWFNATSDIDSFLEIKFIDWIDDIKGFINYEIPNHYYEILTNKEAIIALIIVFDQIPRHTYRNSYGAHCIQYYLQFALHFSKYIQNTHSQNIHLFNSLNAFEWSFVQLPWRHTQDISLIHEVMRKGWNKLHTLQYLDNDDITSEILHMHKFLRATYERCPMSQINFIKNTIIEKTPLQNIPIEWSNTLYKRLLAYAPEDSPDHSQYVSIENIDHLNIYKECEKTIKLCQNVNTFIISLSGGIDSMICSYIFSKIKRTCKQPINICAIHIDYWNRRECLQEEEFLSDWCRYLDIPLYIRRITEIQRKQAMDNDLREVYETYTRNVRYNTYKDIWTTILLQDGPPCVILGHNQDDCIENILTNITHQCKYDNLTGMTRTGIQDNISFIRPLLNITKQEIYKFSKQLNIPHLQNSTPSWSMRGQIRDNIRPVLEQWNKNSINSLLELSHNVSELYSIMYSQVEYLVDLSQQNLKKYDINNETYYGLWESKLSLIQTSTLFWKAFLYKLTAQAPSIKSLKAFENQLNRFKLSNNSSNNLYTNSTVLSVRINHIIHIYIQPLKGSELYKISIMQTVQRKK